MIGPTAKERLVPDGRDRFRQHRRGRSIGMGSRESCTGFTGARCTSWCMDRHVLDGATAAHTPAAISAESGQQSRRVSADIRAVTYPTEFFSLYTANPWLGRG
jgi:hypothetical protein